MGHITVQAYKDVFREGAQTHACFFLIVQQLAGEVVLYDWVEWLKEEHSYLYVVPQPQQQHDQGHHGEGWEDAENQEWGSDSDGYPDDDRMYGCEQQGNRARTLQRAPVEHAADEELMTAMRNRIVSGEPHTERKSTFQVLPLLHEP